MTLETEANVGLENITRQIYANWYARKYITDDLWAECPPVAEWHRHQLRRMIMKEFHMIDVIAGKKRKVTIYLTHHDLPRIIKA